MLYIPHMGGRWKGSGLELNYRLTKVKVKVHSNCDVQLQQCSACDALVQCVHALVASPANTSVNKKSPQGLNCTS